MQLSDFANHFIGLLVIANPLSALPAVLRITRNQTLQEKRHTGLVSTFTAVIIMLIVTWVGSPLLFILGIQLPSFQVAGGVILFMIALSMLNAEESSIKHNPEEVKDKGDFGAVVPLAIPIIAGPGAISTLIVSVSQYPGLLNQLFISISAILVCICMGILLFFAVSLEKLFGKSGINIINRLGGLILAAISIEMLANGVIGLFPILKG
ncbi:MAG: hypothetical protein ACD_17C00173G0001 [uncultured bacterium]|nr:MAG: hypothetical protein ACD_17C00173G0001 [uncultured bacterium]OGN56033.1 MAG: hypothetical protein A2796_05515 [Chlamydiae bacterium RIFCSPHIGHO2_01_FULL_44_39]OGN56749.1 MAG: hypothetical protein A3C42_04700 [Chlamydiae bacterium RIFCSPHIGHO2_02_FULL_45_9]OGN60878.1 MAG: hypothetical protein A3D96_01680 [Chlamydiae bacterium RIFCSPHIGHO2_12_FULL_44_59]OGN66464.1 MAG: hypothetical protein A2978_01300 [Chlamydiae bacterium RIFCSPLOWO2_01_FULL_44_52]OGN69927.1 MAG: hypothetical protein A3